MRRRPFVVLAGLVVPALIGLASVPAALASSAGDDFVDPLMTDSARELAGRKGSEFEDLRVTVGKTRNLGGEATVVSWKWVDKDPRSHATPNTGWSYNYMTVFQCWADEGQQTAVREQCQYGGKYNGLGSGGESELPDQSPGSRPAVSRIVSSYAADGSTTKEFEPTRDHLEANPPTGPDGNPLPGYRVKKLDGSDFWLYGLVPLHPAPRDGKAQPVDTMTYRQKFVNGTEVTLNNAVTARQFDPWTTNEILFGRTGDKGTGKTYFQMHTGRESPFLGCGESVGKDATGAPIPRKCWLVVVPRGVHEVPQAADTTGRDVRTGTGADTSMLRSSPLSMSNWQNRIEFPLEFNALKEKCPQGGAERPVIGHESLFDAVVSWQSPLCKAGKGYSYAAMTDDLARGQAVGSTAQQKLSVVTEPISGANAESSLRYAPIASSGFGIALFIERSYPIWGPGSEYQPYLGTRVERLRLNQRLVAKLLTQSYNRSIQTVPAIPEHVKDAPQDLAADPEFQALNQGFLREHDVKHIRFFGVGPLAKLYVSQQSSDAVRMLWQWILADRKARGFLKGEADEWGMKVNKYYLGAERTPGVLEPYESAESGARSDVPRLDTTKVTIDFGKEAGKDGAVDRKGQWDALDDAPYAEGGMDRIALSIAMGIGPGRGPVWDDLLHTIKAGKPGIDRIGNRAVLGLVDTPSAQKRGLVMASLPNADGEYVAPTVESMTDAVSQSRATDITGVRHVVPERVGGKGYPLTRLQYAVTNPSKLDEAARTDYANFIEYAATDGQRIGSKPGDLPPGYAPLSAELQAQAKATAEIVRSGGQPGAASPSSGQQPTAPQESGSSAPDDPSRGDGPSPGGSGTPDLARPEPASVGQPVDEGAPEPSDGAGVTGAAGEQAVSAGPTGSTRLIGGFGRVLPAVLAAGLVAALASQYLLRRRAAVTDLAEAD